MQDLDLPAALNLFSSRLDTLGHLLSKAQAHFDGSRSFLDQRLAPDMHPLRTQVVYACNQPHNLVLWVKGEQPTLDPGPEVATLEQARVHLEDTKALLLSLRNAEAVPKRARIVLGPTLHIDMPAHDYVNDFLTPNFYFHLVTAYAILRMAGVPIGKADYMLHMKRLVPHDSA